MDERPQEITTDVIVSPLTPFNQVHSDLSQDTDGVELRLGVGGQIGQTV